jgi:CHAD domain-containing protein
MTASSPKQLHAIRIRRLLRAELKRGIEAVEDERHPLATRVHDMRTALRRARAVLKLARPLLRRRAHEEMSRMARTARSLSVVRDAEAVVETVDRVSRQVGGSARSLAGLRRRLNTRRRTLEQRPKTLKALQRAGRALRRIRRRVKGLWQAPSAQALGMGFAHEYRKARQASKAAYRRDGLERFHLWRKIVKTHAFHVKLLAAAGVTGMEGRLAAIESLGTALGEDHDLAVLETTIRAERACFADPRDYERLSTLIVTRQRAIRAEVRPLARRLFAERPAAMRRIVARGLAANHLVA